MRMTRTLILFGWAVFTAGEGAALAKGLDQLSENNPEKAEEAPAEGGEEAEAAAEGEQAATTPPPPSAASAAISQKLYLATSYGWVKASRSEGDWEGSGMSDLTVGYRIMPLGAKMSVDGTYRFAPVAVSGVVDEHTYRGIWETHFFGGRFNYNVSPTMTAIGTAELGYVVVHLNPTDNLELDPNHEKSGAAFAVGGGADFFLFEKNAFAVGPRLALGFGSVSTIQVAASVSFVF